MDPFTGQISLFAFGKIPQGWAACNGQLLPISQNPALYSLLLTTYGGDAKTTFALPDLRGRVAVQATYNNADYKLGVKGGAEGVTLTTQSMPSHNHSVGVVNAAGNKNTGLGNHLAGPAAINSVSPPLFAGSNNLLAINPTSVSTTGSGGAHSNMQPFLAVTFCIAVVGIYPPRP